MDYNKINFRNKDIDRFSTRFGKDVPTSKRKRIREMREGVTPMKNEDGSTSTHALSFGESDNKKKPYEVNPTVFPNDGGKTWTDLSDNEEEAYKEAKKRNEVVEFKSAKRAERFSYGTTWKKGEDKKDAKAAYRQDKKEGELYTQSEQFKKDKERMKSEKK